MSPVFSLQVCARASSQFASYALAPDNVQYFFKNKGIDWIAQCAKLSLVETSPAAVRIQQNSLLGMARMCATDYHVHAIMTAGGVQCMVQVCIYASIFLYLCKYAGLHLYMCTMQALSAHKRNVDIVTAALTAATSMLIQNGNPEYAKYVVAQTAAHVATAIAQHPDNAQLTLSALQYYKKIAAHSACLPKLFEIKAPEHIVQILTANIKDASIVTDAFLTFGRIMASVNYVSGIIRVDKMASVVAAINQHLEDKEVLKLGMALLENVAMCGEKHVALLTASGAMKTLLKVMEMYEADREISNLANSVICTMNGDRPNNEARDAVGMLSNVARQLNTADALTQGQMVGSLVNSLTMVSHLALVDSNLEGLISSGAILGLTNAITTLRAMPMSADTEKLWALASTGLLRLVAGDRKAQLALVQGGHVASLLTASRAIPGDLELASNVLQLTELCMGVVEGLQPLVDAGAIESMLALYKLNSGDEKLLAVMVSACVRLASNPAHCQQLVAHGGCEVMSAALAANLSNVDEVIAILGVISPMSATEEGAAALVNANCIESLVKALMMHKDNALVVEGVLSSLCPLLISEEAATQIGTMGALPLLVETIRAHYQNGNIVETDIVLLDSLSSLKANQAILLEPNLNTIALVEWGMQSYAANSVIQESGRRMIATLGKATQAKKKILVKGKVPESKVAAVLAGAVQGQNELKQLNIMLQSSVEVAAQLLQSGGLSSMVSLLTLSPSTDQAMFYDAADAFMCMLEQQPDAALLDGGVAGALINMLKATETFGIGMDLSHLSRAMSTLASMQLTPDFISALSSNSPFQALLQVLSQSDDPELLTQAAKLLAHLCTNDETLRQVSSAMNLRQLIAAMRRNIRNTDFLRWAVFLLAKLAESKELQAAIGVEGGVAVCCQILELYWDNKDLLANVLFCLGVLATDNSINASFIAASRGAELLVACLDAYPKDSEILLNAVNLLRLLASAGESNREAIVRISGCDAISDCILNNFNNIDVVRMCFRTFGTIATSASFVASCIRAGAVQGLVAGMTVHASQLGLINVAMKVLAIFAKSADADSMNTLTLEGAVQAIVEAMSTYVDNIVLESTAIDCLYNLCKAPQNVAMVIKQDGAVSLIKTMETNGYEEKLCRAALKLMQKLTTSLPNLARLLNNGVTASCLTVMQTHPENFSIRSSCLTCFARLVLIIMIVLIMRRAARE
jgi:hypothetical protein